MNFHFLEKSDCGFVVHYPIDKKVYYIIHDVFYNKRPFDHKARLSSKVLL